MICVAFRLNELYFGFEIREVVEVVKEYTIKDIPGVNPIIKGMVNLRGEIITVVDLKKRLHLEQKKKPQHDIMIMEHNEEHFGLFIDEVMEVVALKEEDIQRENKNIFKIQENFLKVLGKIKGKPLMILDLKQVLEF